MTEKELQRHANCIRKLTLQTIARVGKGHVGGALSLCEVMSVLYYKQMNIDPLHPKWEDRDRFILSKGHAGPVVYAALALKGYFDVKELETMNEIGTRIPSHCDGRLTTGIDMTTGSLGQGFSVASGMASAAKLDKKNFYIYCIIGDGESQEGQVWEVAMYAGNHQLDNLIVFTDYNKMQIDGLTSEINSLEPLDKKWEAFNWYVQTVDGHDIKAIDKAIDNAKKIKGKPSMIILNTVKGKGAYFAENNLASHSMNVSKEECDKAIRLLDELEEAIYD
ncbi:MAG: transketolase [Longicatena sp.]